VSAAGADPVLQALLTPEAVRGRCNELWQLAEGGALPHFTVHLPAMEPVCARVVEELQRNYPDGHVPYHSRWRHFELAGRDLARETLGPCSVPDVHAHARSQFDLAVTSVLLDAGAGSRWQYRDATLGVTLGRSEGLALASLRAFQAGLFSTHADDALRCDASAISALTTARLAKAMQSDGDNELLGVEGRCNLLRRLGESMTGNPAVFTRSGETRPGHLYDHLREQARDGELPARSILVALLAHLGEIWPGGRRLGSLHAGDVGEHPALRRRDASDGLVPFHKLSQWLAYSLMEPMEEAGIRITEPDALTGLPEYRNGGLLMDCGLLRLRDDGERQRTQDPTGILVTEWRALTVAALDRIAAGVRGAVGLDAERLPLAAVLQAGTWSAGRRIAAELRPGGPPPIILASDGTLF
jgi:hypothetical protein